MKKTIISFAFICILAVTVHAQGLYIGGGLGYGMRAGGTVFGLDDHADGSSTVVKGSYGAGLIPNIGIGYLFTRNVGVELGAGYLIGHKRTVSDDFGNSMGDTDFSANSFYLTPSIVFRGATEEGSVLVPYGKIGMFLGLANHGTVFSHTDNYNGSGQLTNMNETKFETKGGLATGLSSTLGLDFMVSDKFSIYGELNGRLASYAPSSYTASTSNTNYVGGVAQPTTESSVSGNFVKEVPDNYTGTDTPTQVLPFSSIGFTVGVRWFLK
jgi:outer membrane protein W